MLTVHRSNRLERLAERLAETVGNPAGDVFSPEIVLVQSDKTGRWLSLKLAESLGIAANIEVAFPAKYVWKLLGQVVPGVPETSPFDPDVVTWRLADILSRERGTGTFAPLASFLGEEEERRRFELCRRLAALFDSYLVYRPEWLEQWHAKRPVKADPGEKWTVEDRRAEKWQSELWRRLAAGVDEQIREHPVDRLFRELREHPERRDRLPRRLSLFGLRDLPPAYWRVFRTLSEWLDLHLFVMSPCRSGWSDSQGGAKAGTVLDAWGGHGKVFLEEVASAPRGPSRTNPADKYDAPGEDSLLHRLQSAILDNLGAAGVSPSDDDPSIAVHSCHGSRRELEVLHDQLLAILDKLDPDPSHIGVLLPDIQTYAPYIDAVFGSSPQRIPYAIADVKGRLASPALAGFLALLDFPVGRFEASRVLGILENPAVSRCFGLDERDLERIRAWVRKTGIRWGFDERSRDALGLPGTAEHTWRTGLDRLLLGYAMPGEGNDLYEGVLPSDVEGDGAFTLGKLATAVDALASLREELGKPRTPAGWAAYLQSVISDILEPRSGEEGDVDAIRKAVRELERAAALAGFGGKVAIEPVRDLLESALDRPLPSPHLSGKLTFGSLASLSSLPFATVCLVGMNDGVFPAAARPPDFDLLARHPRRGDRVRREEDRYIFLEAILSARERLYISYCGKSERDDTSKPPSVLVTEFLDRLAEGLTAEAREEFLKKFVVRHPLQPFSHKYFEVKKDKDARLFSYAGDLCLPPGTKGREEEGGPLLTEPLPDERGETTALELGELVRFYQGPVRRFLQRRLGVHIEEGEEPSQDREPFELEKFKDGKLRTRLVTAIKAGKDDAELDHIARAGGELPQGAIGRVIKADQIALARSFAERLNEKIPDPAPEPRQVDVPVAGIRLTGQLDRVTKAGQVGFELGGIWDKDYLAIWIRHLAFLATAPSDCTMETHWLTPKMTLVFGPVDKPEEHLEKLITWYREGMRRPIHLFPKTSLAAARELHRGKPGFPAALQTWKSDEYNEREDAKPYHRIAFRGTDPLDTEFNRLVDELLIPMLNHLTEESHA